MMRFLFICLIFLTHASNAFAELDQQAVAEIRELNWKEAINVRLGASRALITGLPGFSVVVGEEARRVRELTDATKLDALEAEAVNPTTGSEIVYEWLSAGYVTSGDWSDVDPNALLSQMQQDDISANEERRKRGLRTLTTTGWRQTPRLNSNTHAVSWIVEGAASDGSRVINAVALKLGRYGFEKIVWIGDANATGAHNDLLLAENAFEFQQGARYDDYVAGSDRAATYGVAGLVAGALAVKLLKAAGAGALLLGLKKFGILLLLPFVWLWRKITGLFGRKATKTFPSG